MGFAGKQHLKPSHGLLGSPWEQTHCVMYCIDTSPWTGSSPLWKSLLKKWCLVFQGCSRGVQSPEGEHEFSISHNELRLESSHICSNLFILKPCFSWAADFISEGFSHLFYTLGYANAKMYTNVHVFAFSSLQNHSASMTEVTWDGRLATEAIFYYSPVQYSKTHSY